MTPPAPARAEEAVRRSLQQRQETARVEVGRLIEAGRELYGAGSDPRVVDIVKAAGVSIEAFYRYFGSKGEFVAAVAEDGAARVTSYVAHKMHGVQDPTDRMGAAIDALMSQAARPELATAARNILGRAGQQPDEAYFEMALAAELSATLDELGSTDVERDARVAATTLVGVLQGHVWGGTRPTKRDREHLTRYVVHAVRRSAALNG